MQRLLIALVVSGCVVGCAQEQATGPTGRPTAGTGPVSPAQTQQPLMPFRPVVGGHLVVSADGMRVVMADVEGDRLRLFSTNRVGLELDVTLPEKSWPTRIVEGHDGAFHVLLRGTGALATVKEEGGQQVVSVVEVCAEPRALAIAALSEELTVGCAGGEVVRVLGGKVIESTPTGVEWRDLAVTPDGLVGTSFRSAEFITLPSLSATPVRTKAPPQRLDTTGGSTTAHLPQVAWRMVQAGAKTFVIHQLHADRLTVESAGAPDAGVPNGGGGTGSNPYGGGAPTMLPGQMVGCGNSAVVTAISTVENGVVTSTQRSNDILPVDAAVSPDGTQLAVVGAGGTGLSIYRTAGLTGLGPTCLVPVAGLTGLSLSSVAWVSPTKLAIVESLRGSPLLFDLATGQARAFTNDAAPGSTAHLLFHQAPRGGAPLACASCHPEGGEDGHTWIIDGKPRRTQTLAGGVMARMPFHWKGDLPNLDGLMADTFVKRMGGTVLMFDQVTALGHWLDTIPAPKPSRRLSPEQAAAGEAAFNKATCNGCHLEAGMREGPVSDIGTGELVRAPSLSGLAARAPYLHTGEVPDIRSRVMGGLHPQHGRLGNLGPAEREELIAWLESR
ncbi:MAG: cytochrome c [Archangium sp.]|nr:cytochrome c [Archangium sp.]